MNQLPFTFDQVTGILRIIVPGICTWLAAKGFHWLGDEGVEAEAAAVAVAIAAMIWSYFTHSPVNTLSRAAKVDPAIKIEVPDHVVDKYPSVKQLAESHPGIKVVKT